MMDVEVDGGKNNGNAKIQFWQSKVE